MKRIRIALEDELLAAVDAQAALRGEHRSKWIRQALKDHLHRLKIRELEEQERIGYERFPDILDDEVDWMKMLEYAAY